MTTTLTKAYITLPSGQVECPKCNGSGRYPASDNQRKHKTVVAGYDFSNNTVGCQNCGADEMFSSARGHVSAKADGSACIHVYTAQNVGRCLTKYTCTQVGCNDYYTVDSGD